MTRHSLLAEMVFVSSLLLGACAETPPELHVVPGTAAFSALPAGGDRFDCIARYGHFEKKPRPLTSASILVTGEAYFRGVWRPGEWLPVAKVVVRNGPKQIAGFSLTEPPRRHGATVIDVEYWTAQQGIKQAWINPLVPTLGADIPFALRLDGSRLAVRVGASTEWTPVPLAFTPHEMDLICSSAEVIFHDVNAVEPAP